jgi:hypothetical protein
MGLSTVIFLLCTYNYQVNAYKTPFSRISVKLYQSNVSKLYSSSNGNENNEENTQQSQKLIRLNAMASKLRAEASALEAEQLIVVNLKLAQTFALLDSNKDGSIDLQELKDALGYFIVGLFCYICSFYYLCGYFLYLCLIGCSVRFTIRGLIF